MDSPDTVGKNTFGVHGVAGRNVPAHCINGEFMFAGRFNRMRAGVDREEDVNAP